MKTFLDASIFSLQIRGGISRYTFEIASYLTSQSSDEMLLGLLPGYQKNIFSTSLNKFEYLNLPWPILEHRYFSKKIASHRFKIIHSPYLLLPKKAANRVNVLTVHDLISLEAKRSVRTQLKNRLFVGAVQRADAIIFISNETKRIFSERFEYLNKNAISEVIYNGVGRNFRPSGKTELVSASLDSDRNYVLWVGPRAGYKNFIPFVEAYRHCKAKNDLLLVLIGGPEPDDQELELLKNTDWKRLTDVSDQLLSELYSGASALFYPSAQEGFGLPILEAMKCACPVICFNVSAMREVSAGHAIYLDDFSPDEIDRTIDTALGSDREVMTKNALQHAENFSWENTGALTRKFYSSIC